MPDFDAVVLGGGPCAAAILRDLALRGFSALLVRDAPPGPTETVLLEGGLEVLASDRLAAQTACWDAGHLVRIARPLLRRLPLLRPVYRWHRTGLGTLDARLEAYDPLSAMRYGRAHLRLDAGQTLRLVPSLVPEGLLGAVSYDEWQADAGRLSEAHLESAKRAGAQVLRAEVVGLIFEEKRVRGVKLRGPGGRTETASARLVINAAGAGVGEVARLAGTRINMDLRKEAVLSFEGLLPCLSAGPAPIGLALEAPCGERPLLLLPDGAGTALVSPGEDASAALSAARRHLKDLPERCARSDVRTRPAQEEHEILDHAPRDGIQGFMSVSGGRPAALRLVAQDAGETACRILDRQAPCRTQLETLAGEPVGPFPDFERPSFTLQQFLLRRPRLRAAHARAHLGLRAALSLLKRGLGRASVSTDAFFRYYRD